MLQEYIESIVQPLVGKKGVMSRTIDKLRNAGFSLTDIYSMEGKGPSGSVWLDNGDAYVQVGCSLSRRVQSGAIVHYIRVVSVTLSNESQYNSWCRTHCIDEILTDLQEDAATPEAT